MRCLLIGDNIFHSKPVFFVLKRMFLVDSMRLTEGAVDAVSARYYDLVVFCLDPAQPLQSELVSRICAQKNRGPAVVVSPRTDLATQVDYLRLGIDDYIIQPAHSAVLAEQFRAILDRVGKLDAATIQVGRMQVRLNKRRVEIDGMLLHLPEKEYAVLEFLCRNKGEVVTKKEILDYLYGGINEPDARIVDVFVCKLRKKIAVAAQGQHYIHTVWGRGYMLDDADQTGLMAA